MRRANVVAVLAFLVATACCFLPLSTSQAAGAGPTALSVTMYDIPTANSFPNVIINGPDDALWFVEYESCKVAKLTTAGVFSEYNTPTPDSDPEYGITNGPDGALWFSETAVDKLCRITTGGATTEYDTSPMTSPQGIATGSDGDLWFGGYGAYMGQMTTGGSVTRHEGLTQQITQIVDGPDGALWFTEPDNIGRMNTAGGLTEYALTPGSNAWAITNGPDGALWFTETGTSKIGRITTAGAITEYSVPEASRGITTGPDGALWFTEEANNKVGRITVAGDLKEFALPHNPAALDDGPFGIVTGADNALWITRWMANDVCRAMPQYPITSVDPVSAFQGQRLNVNITGTETSFEDGFSDATFSGTGITVNSTSVSSPTLATADITIAADAPPGPRDVNVVTRGEPADPLVGGFTVNAQPPTIASLSAGSAYTGTTITINGTGFGANPGTHGSTYVRFGSVAPAESDYTSWSDTAIQVKVPSNAYGGPIGVKVHTAAGGDSNSTNFYIAPRITTVSPTYGNAGVTIVTLTGTGFCPTQGTSSVWFGSSKATTYSSWSNTQIKVKVGAGAQGQAKVKVMASCCYSNAKAFDVRPVITSITPTSGPSGTQITISGSAFCNVQGSGLVCFGSTNVSTVVSWKQSQIKVKVPSSVPAGAVTVKVYTLGGMSGGKTFTKT